MALLRAGAERFSRDLALTWRHGRVVKAPDSKSGGLCPRRFKSG